MPLQTMTILDKVIFVGGANDGKRQHIPDLSPRVTLPKPLLRPVAWTRGGVIPTREETSVEHYELTILRLTGGYIQFYRIQGMSEYAALLLILARYPKQTPPE